MKVAWLTDIHLNFLRREEREVFYQKVAEAGGEGVLITGDIAEAPTVEEILMEMVNAIKMPIYFVLGNHDYYHGEVETVRKQMVKLCQEQPLLFWLPYKKWIRLSEQTLLMGQDGWADGRLGDYQNTRMQMNDHGLIADLFQSHAYGKQALLEKMQELAGGDVMRMKIAMEEAIETGVEKIIVLTHVPPFKEVSFYRGEASDDEVLPFYSSKVMGDLLLRVAEANVNIKFLVLCGHTHGKAEYHPLENLIVRVGAAEYAFPEVQGLIRV